MTAEAKFQTMLSPFSDEFMLLDSSVHLIFLNGRLLIPSANLMHSTVIFECIVLVMTSEIGVTASYSLFLGISVGLTL